MPSPQLITLNEIRVVSGLSRGAALPLESSLYVGSNPDCDIFLMDPGVEDRHLLIELDDFGVVTVLDLTKPTAVKIDKVESAPFFAGDVELIWCGSDKPWQTLVVDSTPQLKHLDGRNRPSDGALLILKRRRLWIAFITLGFLSIGLLGTFMIRSHGPADPTTSSKSGTVKKLSTAELSGLRLQIEEKLRARFYSQLLVGARDNGLVITGTIRTEQQRELETLVQSWRKENPLVRIALKLTEPPPPALPFEVVAVVGGPTPSVLSSTGQSLYLGSESNGYRLVLLNGACLTFEHTETHQRLKECLDQPLPNR